MRCYLRHHERRCVAGEVKNAPFIEPGGHDCVGLAMAVRIEGREVQKGRRAQDGGCKEHRKDGYIAEGGERMSITESVVGLGYCASLQGTWSEGLRK